MTKAIIILASIAVVLGIVAYFAVFSGTQIIKPFPANGNQGSTTANATTSIASLSAPARQTTVMAKNAATE